MRTRRPRPGAYRSQVKLLFDQNLSHRLCDRLADLGVTLVHVRAVDLEAADDARVSGYAAEHIHDREQGR